MNGFSCFGFKRKTSWPCLKLPKELNFYWEHWLSQDASHRLLAGFIMAWRWRWNRALGRCICCECSSVQCSAHGPCPRSIWDTPANTPLVSMLFFFQITIHLYVHLLEIFTCWEETALFIKFNFADTVISVNVGCWDWLGNIAGSVDRLPVTDLSLTGLVLSPSIWLRYEWVETVCTGWLLLNITE